MDLGKPVVARNRIESGKIDYCTTHCIQDKKGQVSLGFEIDSISDVDMGIFWQNMHTATRNAAIRSTHRAMNPNPLQWDRESRCLNIFSSKARMENVYLERHERSNTASLALPYLYKIVE